MASKSFMKMQVGRSGFIFYSFKEVTIRKEKFAMSRTHYFKLFLYHLRYCYNIQPILPEYW